MNKKNLSGIRIDLLEKWDDEIDRDPFKEYLKEAEPDKISRGYVWRTAVGLQAVDGLRPSERSIPQFKILKVNIAFQGDNQIFPLNRNRR